MSEATEKNKRLVLKGFDTLFNKRDYVAAEKFWSPNYIQHSAHIEPGREGLFNLVKSLPTTLKYESGRILAEGDFVIVHGRYSGALPEELGGSRHSPHRGRCFSRALGRNPGRSHQGRIQERAAYVWREVHEITGALSIKEESSAEQLLNSRPQIKDGWCD